MSIGGHLLKVCDKLIVDVEQQKKFILRFLFMFDSYLNSSKNVGRVDCKRVEDILLSLVETLSRVISLEFLKFCTVQEIKMLFYSVWNVAYETRQREMYKECQILLKSLYEQVKKFSTFYQENNLLSKVRVQ